MNVVVIRGILSSEPVERTLASGSVLVSMAVTTPLPDGRRVSVPVAWFDPPPERPAPGDEVVVSGTVQRRFFSAAGGTGSRTEIVAERVVAARRSRAVAALLRDATTAMG
jgi:hypothetical protein